MNIKKMAIVLVAGVALGAWADYKAESKNGYMWIYEQDDEESYILGIAETPSGTLSFPTELGGKPVRNLLRSWSFDQYEWVANEWGGYWTMNPSSYNYDVSWLVGVTKVVIPEGITNIYDRAFSASRWIDDETGKQCVYGWINLDEVSLPDSLVSCNMSEAFSGTPFYRSTKFPDFVFDKSGSKLWGVKEYYGEWYFDTCPDVVVPASVTEIADYALGTFRVYDESGKSENLFNHMLGDEHIRIVFDGAKPKASDKAFVAEWWDGEYARRNAVYYHEGAPGWSWGEGWCGMKTLKTYSLNEKPEGYTVGSGLKFGRVYGGEIYHNSGWSDYAIWNSNDIGLYGDEYALIPVTGTGTIKPVILGDVPSDYLDAAQVWTDQELFDTFTPKGVAASRWEDDGDDWGDDEWCYETSKSCWYWPKEIWPARKPVAGRRWIVIHAKSKGVWSGVWSFRVGLSGTSEISDPMVVVPSEEAEENGLLALPLDNFFHGISISGYENFELWDEVETCRDGSFSDEDRPRTQNIEIENGRASLAGKPMSFNVALPSAGTFVVSSGGDADDSLAMQDVFSVTGAGIVSDVVSVKSNDYESPDYRYSVMNFWKTSNSSHIRRITVAKATTLTFTSKTGDDDCALSRMYFFPKDGKSVAVEVGYATREKMDGEYDYHRRDYVQGYVIGNGVYKSGETATIKAVSGTGEVFDHWEVRFGNLTLTDAQKTSPTLAFKVTDAMCGAMADEEQIFISAYWKPKNKITALPSIVGAGTVTGTGRYIDGAVATLTAEASRGYDFVKWSDGVTDATRNVRAVAADVEHVIYACFTPNGDSQPDPVPEAAGKLNPGFAKAQTVDGALYRGDELVGTVQVKAGKINKKNQVKISATATLIANGAAKKIMAKAVNVTLDAQKRVLPVEIAFKAPIGKMTFEMAEDGTFALKNASYQMAAAKVGGALNGGSRGTFRLDDFSFAVKGELQDNLVPYEEPFRAKGKSWTFEKAATVKWAKDKKTKQYGLVVDDSKGKTNLSGLKLTYASKTGQFKGSFKVYVLETAKGKTKLVKYTVNVIGFVVDGVGHGEASCKKPASGPWPVTVE